MSRILHFCSFPHPVSNLKRCALCGSTAIVNSLAFHPDALSASDERGTSRLHVKFFEAELGGLFQVLRWTQARSLPFRVRVR
jgi:hypothetical protein